MPRKTDEYYPVVRLHFLGRDMKYHIRTLKYCTKSQAYTVGYAYASMKDWKLFDVECWQNVEKPY